MELLLFLGMYLILHNLNSSFCSKRVFLVEKTVISETKNWSKPSLKGKHILKIPASQKVKLNYYLLYAPGQEEISRKISLTNLTTTTTWHVNFAFYTWIVNSTCLFALNSQRGSRSHQMFNIQTFTKVQKNSSNIPKIVGP